MDGYDLFKKLGVGAKIDFKRFQREAQQLHLTKIKDTCHLKRNSVPHRDARSESDANLHSCHLSSRNTVDLQNKRKIIDDIFDTKKRRVKGHSNGKGTQADVYDNDDLEKVNANEHVVQLSRQTCESDSDSDSSTSGCENESESDIYSSGNEEHELIDSGMDSSSNISYFEESIDNKAHKISFSDVPVSDEENETDSLQILGTIKSTTGIDGEKHKHKSRNMKKKPASSAEKQFELRQEKLNHVRNVHKIKIYGSDKPEPISCFQELMSKHRVHEQILKNIARMGYKKPTPVQMQVIPVMLENREVLACAPTGSGKTAAFIIPILHQLGKHKHTGLRAVVLVPTRELAQQIYQEFQRLSFNLGFKILCMQSESQGTSQLKYIMKHDVLVTTPNRLVFMLQEPNISIMKYVEWLVVDESDKLFQDGKLGFRDQLGIIYKACDNPSIRHALFSATFAKDVIGWCKLNLDNIIQVYIGAKNIATSTVKQQLQFVGTEAGKLIAMRDLIKKGVQPPVLVFVQSKDRAKELFRELVYDNVKVDVIHADRTQSQRDNVIKNFRAGKIWILICTDVMGRGMDFKGVNLVINYDFPNSAVSYIHRVGRTGRAGRNGNAVTYFTESDVVNLRSIANVMREAGCEVPEYMLKIKKAGKEEKRKMARSAPVRESISTVPLYDIEKRKKKNKKNSMKSSRIKNLKDKQKEVVKDQNSSSVAVKKKVMVEDKKLKYFQLKNELFKKKKKKIKRVNSLPNKTPKTAQKIYLNKTPTDQNI